MASCSPQELEYIINHVVLPPRLPQQAESIDLTASAERSLLGWVLSWAEEFERRCAPASRAPWTVVQQLLRNWIATEPHLDLSEQRLERSFSTMKPGGEFYTLWLHIQCTDSLSDVLPIRIQAQNAAIIFRHIDIAISIECFELSSLSADVMECKGGLLRSFPAHGLSIPINVATDPKFRQELCAILGRLALESVDDMMPQSKKAGTARAEIRDTCHPGLVTEMLMATLAAVGEPIRVLQVQKRIRDDVLWNSCLLPWRRSSLWLLLRISIQTTLAHKMSSEEAVAHYKSFMVYLLADILAAASKSDNGDRDLCKAIQMKMARRAAKLNGIILPFVQDSAFVVAEAVAQSQEERWQELQQKDADRATGISLATLKNDMILTLCNSHPALDHALRETERDSQPVVSIPSSSHEWITIRGDDFPVMRSHMKNTEEEIYSLAEYEEWVWTHLPLWLERALVHPCATQCVSVSSSVSTYKDVALKTYAGCPEQMSLMLLVVGELWRALDSIAGRLTPLLHEFSPQISSSIFHTLLLPKKVHMQRLHDLELHINRRHQATTLPNSSLFADPSTSNADCFAYRYYEQSASHRDLREKIVAEADEKRLEKTREWQRETNRYKDLKRQHDAIFQCDMTATEYGYDEHNESKCRKCDLKREMTQMRISIFEWPLPKDEVSCRLVVFELCCPTFFSTWRNLTWMFLHDLGRPRVTLGKSPHDYLNQYAGLSSYYQHNSSRIVLGASTKSVNASHYRNVPFPVELEKVCSDHGLRWQYYDTTRGLWLCDQTEKPSFASKCVALLPEGPYSNLQYTVDSTGHGQNGVLAAQTDCSSELNLHEFLAYGSLRADGERTQWLNICRELAASNLSWNTEAVCTLTKHAAWQVGAAGRDYLRLSHSVFGVPEFVAKLLCNTSRVVASIRANRQSVYTMNILVAITLRILSLGGDAVVSDALSLLRDCRTIVSTWLTGLAEALRRATKAKQILSIRRSLLRVALLCKLTFDVDSKYVSDIMTSSEELRYWTTSSMIVHDNTPGAESGLSADLCRLLLCDRKLSHTLHRRLQHVFTATANAGLDLAVLGIWSAFKSTDNLWKYHGATGSRWLCKDTLSGPFSNSQTVYYNVLNGQLLIDGRPLGTLPKEYTSHSLFIRIFGAQILRVSASNMAGMLYMTANEEYGYKLHFVIKSADLIIWAQTASTVFELIPHERFRGDFPTIFIDDYVHWLDLQQSELEFRPLSQKWLTSSENWRLHYDSHGMSRLQKENTQLVDIRSPTFQRALAVFSGLEQADFMHVTASLDDQFEVALPRLGFRFIMNRYGELECQELRKIVDHDQSIGTMVGLRSRLVLCAKGERSKGLDRTVLIPKGDVLVQGEGSHITVRVSTTGRDVRCLRYQRNALLNRLDGDGSVVSRLYQAYLHALTAYILPDPLTGKLGTEESLGLLREQKFRCCKPLETAEIYLLELVAGLTPQRTFYPTHLRVMQHVNWHESLSPFSQHGDFQQLAEEILSYTQQFSIFYTDADLPRALRSSGDASLLRRARLRNATYLNAEYGGNERSLDFDMEYKGRDGALNAGQATLVFDISSLIASWSQDLAIPSYQLGDRWNSWGTVYGIGTTFNFSPSISDLLHLSYSSSWAPLYGYCRRATQDDARFKLMFLFSIIAYGSKTPSVDDLKILLAFATNPSLQLLPQFPDYSSFTLSRGSTLDNKELRSTINAYMKGGPDSWRGTTKAERRQERSEYQKVASLHLDTITKSCADQWPCKAPTHIKSTYSPWIETKKATTAVQNLFAEWFRNRECRQHLELIQNSLNAMAPAIVRFTYELTEWHQVEPIPRANANPPLPTLEDLMASRSPIMPNIPPIFNDKQDARVLESNQDLRSLIINFDTGSQTYDTLLRTQYKNDLLKSLDAFQTHEETISPSEIPHYTQKRATGHLDLCQRQCLLGLDLLCGELQPQEPVFEMLKIAGLWPRLRLRDFLSAISSVSPTVAPPEWKKGIVALGIGVTVMQRARRLVLAAEKGDALSFFKEFENPGRLGWSAHDRPDWLLVEIENDLLVRPIQARVALEMIEPSTSANTLMQLNMGEGKSSVIIPLIAAVLANGEQVLKVVVLRSLARQMQDTILQRLGGLAGRPIYYMPFSRKTNMNEEVIRKMKDMYLECMKSKGILIAQPEHVLSFKLMGIERFVSAFPNRDDGEAASGPLAMATKLLDTQAWLERHCRDVLDESDEILDVKFQLIYTLGPQRSMDGQPDRWLMMQSVFDLVDRQAHHLQRDFPDKIEVSKQTSSSFPTIRLLSTTVRELLISSVSKDIGDSRVLGLVMSNLPISVKEAAAAFITNDQVTETHCRVIQAHCTDDEIYLKKLLFLRGLISGGILLHALCDKRWSVNYGLHLRRCLCAVPYRAKGVPAPTAEFGHPDVTIALTCLSYYYSGLTDTQLRTCLEILGKADDPTAEFDTWISMDVDSFPEALRHWSAVNLEDQQQCEHLLFPALRFNKKAADFFMTNVVFPKEGKEFDQKLSTSGWDIPARPASQKVTTGFSGTNDNRFLLPSTIAQHDLRELRHTSGKVLEFVSRRENLGYTCARDEKGAHLSTEALLQFIQSLDPNVRVLIDVGAQILDLANDQVIGHWLPLVPNADAGVYFDENDYAMVLTKMGKKEKLATSSYLNRMDRCLVYLDDVHTRGTDLKLPINARAAVTLGPRLSKDRLVQACMRLRQLGHGQSLMFVAPPEVHQEIVGTAAKGDLNGLDVIKWALEQSCSQIQRNQPLRVTQGLHYYQRLEILDELTKSLPTITQTDDANSFKDLIDRVIEHEAQSLRDLYAPQPMRGEGQFGIVTSSRSKHDKAIQDLIEIWDSIDLKTSQGANIHEEHEREVAQEIEQETQIERPPSAEPRSPKVDPKLHDFIRSGTSLIAERFASVYEEVLRYCSAAELLKGQSRAWSHVRLSHDFYATVKRNKTDTNNNYLRPVNWVLVSRDPEVQTVVLISQYEANQLLEAILASSSRVALVCYEPRVTKSMPSLDAFSTSHPLPHAKEAWEGLSSATRQELHLFAGQLYFTRFAEYQHLNQHLDGSGTDHVVPLHFIKEWVGIRRKGQDYLKTHVGQIVGGRVLHKEMFADGNGNGDESPSLFLEAESSEDELMAE
ncbi:MAG: hypothetical protein Q9184_004869 [Pyrenodesmia sp. 2 TL-2023]